MRQVLKVTRAGLAGIALTGAVLSAAVIGAPAMAIAQSAGIAGPYLAAEQAAKRGDIQAAAQYFSEALAADPQNSNLLQQALLHQIAAGKLEGAMALARRLEELAPGHHLSVLMLASDALKSGEPARATEVLELEDAGQGPFVGRLIAAWAALGAEDAEGAVAALEGLKEDGTGGTAGAMMAEYHLGLINAAAGNDEAAVTALDRSVEISGGQPTRRITTLKAGALSRLGKTDDAVKLLDERLQAGFTQDPLLALRDEIAAGDAPEPLVVSAAEGAAESLYGVAQFLSRGSNRIIGLAYSRLAVYLNPDLTEAKLAIAQHLDADAQYELAIAAYEAIPRDAPEALSAAIGRANAMREAGRVEPAIVAMREVAARYPKSLEAHTSLGDMLRREERFADAAEAYDAALQLVTNEQTRHWVLYYQRGIAYERSQQWESAEADFKKALELQPDQPLVLNYLGYSWVEMGRNLEEAQTMIEKAVEQRPEDGYIVDSLGWVLYRLGDFEGATKHLERAVELRPVDPVINDHFGDALWQVGRKIEAEFQWKRALSFEPEEKDAARIRRKLEVGLDQVLAEEKQAETPALIGGSEAAPASDGG